MSAATRTATYRAAHPEKIATYLAEHREEKAAYDATYYAANRETLAADRVADPRKYKALDLRKDHRMTIDEFNDLLLSQGGVCAICRRPERHMARPGMPRSLSVDHDHATGLRRGLLCSACNLALGKFDDDPSRLQAAITYLSAHEGAQP